jgi:hypothetical protein
MIMQLLKDDQLIDCYLDAWQLKLDNQFLNLLLKEIIKRNLSAVLDNKINKRAYVSHKMGV